VRFSVRPENAEPGEAAQPAFAIRHGGTVRAWLNRCSHLGVQLDWEPGEFLDAGARGIICSLHGAYYDPQTGACLQGPCRGQGLLPVSVLERDGWLILADSGFRLSHVPQ
jgi:nitrite reductase/ring-hydroxylating ferredoxin subunit